MKSVCIILLAVLAVVLGFSFSSLQKELLSVRKSAALYEKMNDDLRGELMRVNQACNEKERFLNEIEQSITELESKVELKTLERYIPKKTWSEIKPIIDRLKAFSRSERK
jgi:predicted nuclease with TOPRIM domain